MRKRGLGLALLAALGVGGAPRLFAADVLPLPAAGARSAATNQVQQVRFNYYDDEAEESNSLSHPATNGKACDTCDSCGNVCYMSCQTCRPGWICRSGVEATFLSPQIDGVPGFVGISDFDNPNDVQVYEIDSDFAAVDNFYVAPRLWLGMQRGCWGVLARYWHLSDSETFTDPLLGVGANDPTGAFATERLDVYTVDVELNRSFCRNCWKMDLGFGVRHGAIDIDSIVTATDPAISGEIFTGTALTSRQFNGTGLTLGLQGRRPVRCGSSLNYFWSARGSVLWGEHDALASVSTSVVGVGGAAANTTFAAAGSDTDLWIGEFQAGLEWNYALKCLPANAFFRVAAEYQYWDVSDGAIAIVDSIAIAPTAAAFAAAEAGDIQMDLIGFSIGAGFTW